MGFSVPCGKAFVRVSHPPKPHHYRELLGASARQKLRACCFANPSPQNPFGVGISQPLARRRFAGIYPNCTRHQHGKTCRANFQKMSIGSGGFSLAAGMFLKYSSDDSGIFSAFHKPRNLLNSIIELHELQ